MARIRNNTFISFLIAISILVFSLRGKYGAILVTLLLAAYLFIALQRRIYKFDGKELFISAFLFIFAFCLHIIRSDHAEFYLIIGYLTAALFVLNKDIDLYGKLWKILKIIAIIEAIGVYLHLFIPNLYYSLIGIVLPDWVVASIRNRSAIGYYNGFSREVSYTMYFIVVGLGLFIYEIGVTNKSDQIKRWISILFLSGALFASGKRAALLFFFAALFIVQFIKSKSKVRILKYSALVITLISAIWISFPLWSRIPALSRIVELIQFASAHDIAGVTNGRTVIYQEAIQLWKENIWFGIGWKNFSLSINQDFWFSGFDVHNCYLQILCETGIIGAVLYFFVCAIIVFNALRALKKSENTAYYNLGVFSLFIQVFFLTYSLTEPVLYEYSDYVLFFIAVNISGIIAGSGLTIKQRNLIQ